MKKTREEGFTLIELLVVIAIIGILAAIAIPQFAEYRKRGFDARAKSDLRNVATGEEAYFVDAEHYLTCSDAACTSVQGGLPGITAISSGVVLNMTDNTTSFTGDAIHPQGSLAAPCEWDSAAGGLQPGC